MATLRPHALPALCSLLLSVLYARCSPAQQPTTAHDLYAQATSVMLDRAFPSPRVEYMVLDLRNGQMIAMRWPHAEEPIATGSLLKPFVALAFAEVHAESSPASRFPVVFCHGKRDGCWHPAGHGSMTLPHALAVSCNAYFLALGRDILAAGDRGTEALNHISQVYGLPMPPAPTTPGILMGVNSAWRMSPLTLAHAYALIATTPETGSDAQVAAQLHAGLKQAAEEGGTASKAGSRIGRVLAKTGTAPCTSTANPGNERCIASGDGLVVLITPVDAPRLLLLVRMRGTTGAQTAEIAGEMLARIQHEDEHGSFR